MLISVVQIDPRDFAKKMDVDLNVKQEVINNISSNLQHLCGMFKEISMDMNQRHQSHWVLSTST